MINNFLNLIQNNIGYSEYGNFGDLLYIILLDETILIQGIFNTCGIK